MFIVLRVGLTGGYNYAATDRHNPIVAWALTTTMRNHVQNAADDLTAPAEITPAMIAAGAREYKTMCAHCHGGIGASRAGWAETMRHKQPAITHAAQGWCLEQDTRTEEHGHKKSGSAGVRGAQEEARKQ